jgi:hypothetical protein
VKYPAPEQAKQQAAYQPVKINQVWFNRLRKSSVEQGVVPPERLKEVEPAVQKQHKRQVQFLAGRSVDQGGFLGQRLRVAEADFGGAAPVFVWQDEAGHTFGILDKKMRGDWVVGQEAIIRQAKSDTDGNLIVMVEPLDEPNITSAP